MPIVPCRILSMQGDAGMRGQLPAGNDVHLEYHVHCFGLTIFVYYGQCIPMIQWAFY